MKEISMKSTKTQVKFNNKTEKTPYVYIGIDNGKKASKSMKNIWMFRFFFVKYYSILI